MHDRRVGHLDRQQLAVEQRRHLTGEADHREQVGTVHRRSHVEHLLAQRQHVGQRRPRLDAVRQHHDAGMVRAEPDLVLGKDHPARYLSPQRPLVERRREAGQQDAGQAHGDGCADTEVPRAAHDLAWLALPHVDLAELELVGVRVLVGRDDLADPQIREVVAHVGDADS